MRRHRLGVVGQQAEHRFRYAATGLAQCIDRVDLPLHARHGESRIVQMSLGVFGCHGEPRDAGIAGEHWVPPKQHRQPDTGMSGIRHHGDQPPIGWQHLLEVSQCVSIARALLDAVEGDDCRELSRPRSTLLPILPSRPRQHVSVAAVLAQPIRDGGRLLSDDADGVATDVAQCARHCVGGRESWSLRLGKRVQGHARDGAQLVLVHSCRVAVGSPRMHGPRPRSRDRTTGRRCDAAGMVSSRRRAHLYTPHTLSSSGRTTA